MSALWCQIAMTPDGWVERARIAHDAGRILAIEAGVDAAPNDERCDIAVPGLPNLHSHAFQRGMAGLAETRGPSDDSFWTWREVMYRFLDHLTPDDVEAIAALAYAEMLESGFTRVGEFHYLHHDIDGGGYADPAELAGRIAAAAAQTGIGLTLLPVFYAQGGFGGAPASPAQRRFLNDPDGFARLVEATRSHLKALPDAMLGIAPHSLRAATPEQLARILPLAGEGPIHIHIAEQTKEVDDCLAWSGQRPVEWLLDHAEVDGRWCLVHATHMTDAETGRLAASGAVAGLCPITEANLGDGLFPAARFAEAGGVFGVGSDSNVLIDAAEELRLLEYGQRLTGRARNVLGTAARPSTGAALFSGALAGGAAALGQGVTGLAPGAPADIVALDADSSLPDRPKRRRPAGRLDLRRPTRRGRPGLARRPTGGRRRPARGQDPDRPPLRRNADPGPVGVSVIVAAEDRALHQRISLDLETQIRSGAWPPGFRIPFEHELTAQYGCARATVNKAVSALAAAGLIERRRRAGSFVARPRVQSAVLEIPDIQAEITGRGQAYGYDLLSRRLRKTDRRDPDEAALGVKGPVLDLRCRHQADGRPFAIEHRILSLNAAPEAASVDFAAIPPGTWLLKHVAWTEAEHRIGAVNPDAATARLLGLKVSDACLGVRRWTWRVGQGITYVRQIFPGDAHDLVARFTPGQ